MSNGNELDSPENPCRNLFKVLLILLGDEDGLDSNPMGCQNLLLKTTNGKHPTSQRDLARHGYITSGGYPGEG